MLRMGHNCQLSADTAAAWPEKVARSSKKPTWKASSFKRTESREFAACSPPSLPQPSFW